jgi:PRTRC genetic system ThiF family protein
LLNSLDHYHREYEIKRGTTMKFNTPFEWMTETVNIALVGAGGSGSQMLGGLSKMDYAIRQLGHHGLDVTVYDPDEVSSSNIGRQNFYPADIGQNKAILLTQRANMFYGTSWQAIPRKFNPEKYNFREYGLIISCVDTAQFRADLAKAGETFYRAGMLLDMGNGASTGQVIFGHLGRVGADEKRLPNVFDYYPNLDGMEEDDEPSCSMEEALSKQDLFVNAGVVQPALNLLWSLLRHGGTDHQGVYVDVRSGTSTPISIF